MDNSLPPSFDGSPIVFAFALFGILLSNAASLAMIVHICRDAGFMRRGFNSPLAHSRFGLMLLFLAVWTATIGDLLVLLTWGEVEKQTTDALWLFDRFMDFITVAPILSASIMIIRGEPEMKMHLLRPPLPIRLYVEWQLIRSQLKIGLVAAILAGGVAFGKIAS